MFWQIHIAWARACVPRGCVWGGGDGGGGGGAVRWRAMVAADEERRIGTHRSLLMLPLHRYRHYGISSPPRDAMMLHITQRGELAFGSTRHGSKRKADRCLVLGAESVAISKRKKRQSIPPYVQSQSYQSVSRSQANTLNRSAFVTFVPHSTGRARGATSCTWRAGAFI